ncbi:unnamed protein product [Lymnaea stagnalis]|uniref:Uncharacterized protein n=1 Tax=Lymnaea stagnalis TaxID=6523 RepID=A0AAV2HAI8_LYMST
MSKEWTHELFGCFDNVGICLLAHLVPCYLFGRLASDVGESCLICMLIDMFIYPWPHICIRGKVREQRDISGTIISDVVQVLCCSCCALAQEAQEMEE